MEKKGFQKAKLRLLSRLLFCMVFSFFLSNMSAQNIECLGIINPSKENYIYSIYGNECPGFAHSCSRRISLFRKKGKACKINISKKRFYQERKGEIFEGKVLFYNIDKDDIIILLSSKDRFLSFLKKKGVISNTEKYITENTVIDSTIVVKKNKRISIKQQYLTEDIAIQYFKIKTSDLNSEIFSPTENILIKTKNKYVNVGILFYKNPIARICNPCK